MPEPRLVYARPGPEYLRGHFHAGQYGRQHVTRLLKRVGAGKSRAIAPTSDVFLGKCEIGYRRHRLAVPGRDDRDLFPMQINSSHYRPVVSYFILVEDFVTVPLLGEEHLAVCGELLVTRVSCDQRVEVSELAVGFGAENPAQPLCLLLTRAEGSGHLKGDVGIGKINREVRDLRHDQQFHLALPEGFV